MKKIIAATLFASVFASAAHASTTSTTTPIQLTANAYVAIGAATDTNLNLARQYNILAVASRAGFVKNSFESTLSANVIAGAFDNATNNRMGVVAGSNKGYVVFTGSSVGGSVSQCGPQIAKTVTNLAASAVAATALDLDKANGCKL